MPRRKRPKLSTSTMTARQRDTYERALHVVSLMRREGQSLTTAARDVGIRPQTVRRYAHEALTHVGTQWKAKPRDRLERVMLFYDDKGTVLVTVRSSTTASRVGEYHNAVKEYLETGDFSKLRAFEGKFIIDAQGRRHPFVADPKVIRRLARAGQFRFESIY